MEAFFRIGGLPLHNVKNCRFSASFSTFYTFRSPRCDFLARYVERKFGHLHRLQLWGWRWKRNIGLRSTVSHLTTLNLRHFERRRKNIYDVIWKNWICRNSEFYNKFTGNRASPCVLGHSKICCTVTCNVRGKFAYHRFHGWIQNTFWIARFDGIWTMMRRWHDTF